MVCVEVGERITAEGGRAVPRGRKHREKEKEKEGKRRQDRGEGTRGVLGTDPAHETKKCSCPGKRLSAGGGRRAELAGVI